MQLLRSSRTWSTISTGPSMRFLSTVKRHATTMIALLPLFRALQKGEAGWKSRIGIVSGQYPNTHHLGKLTLVQGHTTRVRLLTNESSQLVSFRETSISHTEQANQTAIGSSSHEIGPSSSETGKGSCSPTLSEMDALEESFLELEIQSSSPEETTQSKATSQSELSVDSIQTSTDHSYASTLLQSTSTVDLELQKYSSMEDRLKIVWRELSSSSSYLAIRS